jgi:alkylation response protein AidB-like acyl-CoA dehydrogenase
MSTTTSRENEPFALSDAHRAIRAEAQELAARFAPQHRDVRLSGTTRGELHPELWAALCERGWPGLMIAPEHGGTGEGLLAYALVLEELAAVNIVLWPPVLDAAIAHSIAIAGPDPARERWLAAIAAGSSHIGLAVTEPATGHNVFRSRVTVEPDGEGFVVEGLKGITSGTDLVERVLVFGRTRTGAEDGPARFTTVLVDPCADGVAVEEVPMGGREGIRQFHVSFAKVRVGADALVGDVGAGLVALWPSTHVERILTAALAIGNTRYCLSRSLERAAARNVFGDRPIGAEQSIAHPLSHLHARLQAVQLFVHRTAARFDGGVDSFQLAGEANMAKVLAADLIFDAADQAVHTLGAAAWDQREGIVDLYLDARCSRSAPISQELALNFISQHVLGLPSHR